MLSAASRRAVAVCAGAASRRVTVGAALYSRSMWGGALTAGSEVEAARRRLLSPQQVGSAMAMVGARRLVSVSASPQAATEGFLDEGDVTERIVEVVKAFEKVDAAKVGVDSRFAEDLGLDSLDTVELLMAVEEEFGIEIPDAEADRIFSVQDAVTYIAAHPMAK